MKKIIDYGLCCRCEIHYLTKDVNELIAAGYQPYGNPYSLSSNNMIWNYQAMVKYEE